MGGLPKLADVGLVTDLGNPQSLVGTEGYYPPEGPGSEPADIYSLGKVLHEAATAKDRQDFPDLPTRLGEDHDDPALLELNEVLLKACESNTRNRYRTASAMAADMERLQAGQSLRTRRVRRQRVRNIATATALVGGLVLVGVGLVSFIQYQRSKPRLLFLNDFDEPQLDTNTWTWGQKNWFAEPGRGQPISRVEQFGGKLNLRAKVDHDKSSVGQGVWVDLMLDLKHLPASRLEIALSGSTVGGRLAASITDGDTPRRFEESGRVPLVESIVHAGQECLWSQNTIRVEVIPNAGAAIVYSNTNQVDAFDVVDLRDLAAWHLRFSCAAGFSKAFRAGVADLHIQRVAIWSKPDTDLIIGRVVDEISGSPVADATINDSSGKPIATTRASGAFVITRPSSRSFSAERPGFARSSIRHLDKGSESSIVTVALRKLTFSRGDVVEVFPFGNLDVKDIAVREKTLLMLVEESDTACSLRLVDLDSRGNAAQAQMIRNLPFDTNQLIVSFAECGNRLIGIGHWDGRIYDLNSTPLHPFLLLTNQNGSPITWPAGCAFDGNLSWFLESDVTQGIRQLHALNLTTLELRHSLRSADLRMQGLAWDGERFWISSEAGRVHAIRRDDALRGKTVKTGLGPEFPGRYHRLAFGQGYLWGLQPDKQRICKIKITD